MVKKRNQFIDFVKGSAMLLVIWAHCGLKWRDVINYFHMPLFFLLSGLLFTEDTNWSTWLRKKVKGLYVPFAAYEVVFLLLRNLFIKMGLYTTEEWSWMYPLSSAGGGISVVTHIVLFDNADELLATFWFLTALFWVSIVYWVIANFLKRRMTRNILSFILFIFGVILTKNITLIEWSYNFDSIIGTVLAGLWFFSLGDSMKALKEIRFQKKEEIGCAVLCAVVLFGFHKIGLSCDMRSNSYSSVTGFIICSLSGISFWLLFCNRIYLFIDNRFQMLKQAVCNIGRWSLHFMALQFLAMKPASWFICKMLNKPVEGISTFGLVACSRKYQLFGFACTTVLCYFSAMLIEYIKKVIALHSGEHPSRTQL